MFPHFNREKIWIPVKYEKLPKVSFTCGIINHGGNCRPLKGGMISTQFGL